ncbi:unnamed protein product, partial [Rotaria socialis]
DDDDDEDDDDGDDDRSPNSYADIHLSINIFLPKKKKYNAFDRVISDCSNSDDNNPDDIYSDEDM